MNETETRRKMYINSTKILSTHFDFTIFMEHVVPSLTGGASEVLDELVVSMSPEHTKAMFEALKKQMEAYEDKYGIIDVPKASLKDIKIQVTPDGE